MPSHICRFKVLSIKSSGLIDDLGYLIHYVRGETDRRTPTYVAKNSEVDFSKMPEGSAILHFKPIKGVSVFPFSPKYITFELSEYHPNSQSVSVGTFTADCTPIIAKDKSLSSAEGLIKIKQNIYGNIPAEMTVAVLVYSKSMMHLRFDSLMNEWKNSRQSVNESPAAPPSSNSKSVVKPQKEVPKVKTRVMEKEEAKTLLISLEALQERQSKNGLGSTGVFPELTAEIDQLESKRQSLVGSEGLANKIIQARCHGCVGAQFRGLHYKYRANFISTTAAYLRQMALTHHYFPNEDEILDFLKDQNGNNDSTRGETSEKKELEKKIENVEKQLSLLRSEKEVVEKKLQELQMGRNIEQSMPLILSNSSLLDKLDHNIKVQEQSKATMTKQLHTMPASSVSAIPASSTLKKQNASPTEAEIIDIKERIRFLKASQAETLKKINRMNSVAITHIIAWARTRGSLPKEPDPVLPSVDDLFSAPLGTETSAPKSSETPKTPDEREALLNAFDNIHGIHQKSPGRKDAQSDHSSQNSSRSSSSSSSSGSSSSEEKDADHARKDKRQFVWGGSNEIPNTMDDGGSKLLNGILFQYPTLSLKHDNSIATASKLPMTTMHDDYNTILRPMESTYDSPTREDHSQHDDDDEGERNSYPLRNNEFNLITITNDNNFPEWLR